MNRVNVVGAIATGKNAILYLDNGGEILLRGDRWRTKFILDVVAPKLATQKVVVVDLDDYSVEKVIEKKSGGLIRFLKEKVSNLIGLGAEKYASEPLTAVKTNAPAEKETTVAVVNGKRIVGVERLESQMEYAAYQDAKGFILFMERISEVIDDRGHSIDELLNFMKDGDLPIANDGSIVAYKVLNQRGEFMVDPHSGKVKQKLGSRVDMDAKLVDPSRRTECSTGLHIARRDYLAGFQAHVATLVKVAPEDVIAVPEYQASKMRVCGYHIVGVLSDGAYNLLKSGKPMTSDKEAAQLLGDVIAGNHVKVLEYVKIGAAYGEDLEIRDSGVEQKPIVPKAAAVQTLDSEAPKIVVRKIQETVKKAKLDLSASNDLAAAISAPAPIKKEELPKKAKPAAKSQLVDNRHVRALALHDEGKSMRFIEKEVGICRKTLRKLIDNRDNTK